MRILSVKRNLRFAHFPLRLFFRPLAFCPASFDPHPTHDAALAGLFFRASAVWFCIRWLSTPSVLMGFRHCHLTQAHSGFWDCLSWPSWRSIGSYSSAFTHLLRIHSVILRYEPPSMMESLFRALSVAFVPPSFLHPLPKYV